MAKFKEEKGIAMILAVVAVFLLTVAVLATRSGVDLASEIANSSARETQAGYLARSGLAMVSAALAEDETDVDSFEDDWAAANDMGAVPIADLGWAVGKVADEEGKLNVLELVNGSGQSDDSTREAEDRVWVLLTNLGLEGSRADEIVDSLVDWMDEDGTVTGSGAEDPYYRSLVPEYNCPNAPILTIDELALVKGIGPVLLYLGEGDVPPLAGFITVYGDKVGNYRKVNVNTAPKEVLMALSPEISMQVAEEIVAFREEEPFTSPAQVRDNVPGFPEEIYNDIAPYIDVASSHFSARITGETASASSQAFGVFKRKGRAVTLVYYKSF